MHSIDSLFLKAYLKSSKCTVSICICLITIKCWHNEILLCPPKKIVADWIFRTHIIMIHSSKMFEDFKSLTCIVSIYSVFVWLTMSAGILPLLLQRYYLTKVLALGVQWSLHLQWEYNNVHQSWDISFYFSLMFTDWNFNTVNEFFSYLMNKAT